MNKIIYLIIIGFIAISLIKSQSINSIVKVSHAGSLGEYSGTIGGNIPIGTAQNYIWILFNTENTPINFYLIPGTFGNSQGTPIVTYSSMNGVIPANGIFRITVNIAIPSDATVNTMWSNYTTATSQSTNSNNGSQIQIATTKSISIMSTPAPTTTTTTSSTSTSSTSTSTSTTTSISDTVFSTYTTSLSTTSTIYYNRIGCEYCYLNGTNSTTSIIVNTTSSTATTTTLNSTSLTSLSTASTTILPIITTTANATTTINSIESNSISGNSLSSNTIKKASQLSKGDIETIEIIAILMVIVIIILGIYFLTKGMR